MGAHGHRGPGGRSGHCPAPTGDGAQEQVGDEPGRAVQRTVPVPGICRQPSRSALTGSIRLARSAGMHAPTPAVASMTTALTNQTAGSWAAVW